MVRLFAWSRLARLASSIPQIYGLLDVEILYTFDVAMVLIENWRREYDTIRPHNSPGGRPPAPETRLGRRRKLCHQMHRRQFYISLKSGPFMWVRSTRSWILRLSNKYNLTLSSSRTTKVQSTSHPFHENGGSPTIAKRIATQLSRK